MAKETLETLIGELAHEEDWRRMRANAACVRGGPKAIDALILALKTSPPALIMEIAGMLAKLKDPRGGPPLVELLAHEDETVRKVGALALEQMAGILDEATAISLVNQLQSVAAPEDRTRVTHLLGLIPSAIHPLGALFKHADPVIRLAAAELIEHLLDPRSADYLVDAMGDPVISESAVRTLKNLGAIRDRVDSSFNHLRSLEESIEREEARMAIVMNLLGIGRPLVEILIEYLEDEDWLIREAAADLLGKIGDVRAVDPLMHRLRVDKDTGVKELAIKALGLIGDQRPVDLLINAIPIRPLRTLAMEALAKIKDVEVLRPYTDLFERLKTDRDGLVSYNAGMIVDKLAVAVVHQGDDDDE
jgi:HEAT repeat protein